MTWRSLNSIDDRRIIIRIKKICNVTKGKGVRSGRYIQQSYASLQSNQSLGSHNKVLTIKGAVNKGEVSATTFFTDHGSLPTV